jgi:hypothetical protein
LLIPKGMNISKNGAPLKTYKWYSNWRNEQFCCSYCGWSGLGAEAFPDEVGMMECPHCDHGVGYVQFPGLRDTEKAAASGARLSGYGSGGVNTFGRRS